MAPTFHPEFGRFMLEATPGKPWGIGFKDLLDVEPNMKRRQETPHRKGNVVLIEPQTSSRKGTHGSQ